MNLHRYQRGIIKSNKIFGRASRAQFSNRNAAVRGLWSLNQQRVGKPVQKVDTGSNERAGASSGR